MSTDFYLDDKAVSAAEMDPLNTAAAQQSGTGTTGEPVIGQLKNNAAGAKKAKQPMSSKKKVAIVIGGIVAAAGVLTFFGGGQPPAPKMGHPPPIAAPDPATAGAGSMIGAPAAAESPMVMGGAEGLPAGGAPAPALVAQNPGPAQAVLVAGSAQATAQPAVQPAPPTSAPLPAATPGAASMPTPKAPVGAGRSAGTGPVTNVGGWEQSKPIPDKAAPPAPAQAPVSADSAKLTERVADLERKLAKLEHAGETHAAPAARAAVKEKAASAHSARHAKVQVLARAMDTAPSTSVSRASPVTQSSQVVSLDNVHVIGTTTRQGVTSALLSMGGSNKRVTEGQLVPGLGTVSKIGTDAAGNAYAEINGVKYQ